MGVSSLLEVEHPPPPSNKNPSTFQLKSFIRLILLENVIDINFVNM